MDRSGRSVPTAAGWFVCALHLTIQTAPLVPAAHFCVRVLHPCFTHPEPRGGRSAEKRSGAAAPVGRIMCVTDARERAYDAIRQALARRLASHDAGRSPLGAPPWRFFTRGRASVSGMTRIRAASSSQPGRSAWRATSRASRGERLRAARRRTPLLAPPSGSSPETPLDERGCECSSMDAIRSQYP
jgi:hypothetical protein